MKPGLLCGPMVKTPHSQCRGARFRELALICCNKRSHVPQLRPSMAKLKKKKKRIKPSKAMGKEKKRSVLGIVG